MTADILTAAAGLSTIAAAVALIALAGRDPQRHEHDITDYQPAPADPTTTPDPEPRRLAPDALTHLQQATAELAPVDPWGHAPELYGPLGEVEVAAPIYEAMAADLILRQIAAEHRELVTR